jgi:hypothetical protein
VNALPKKHLIHFYSQHSPENIKKQEHTHNSDFRFRSVGVFPSPALLNEMDDEFMARLLSDDFYEREHRQALREANNFSVVLPGTESYKNGDPNDRRIKKQE